MAPSKGADGGCAGAAFVDPKKAVIERGCVFPDAFLDLLSDVAFGIAAIYQRLVYAASSILSSSPQYAA